MSSKKFNPFKDFQSDQIQRSSRKIFTAHDACRNADLNLTLVAGTTNGFIFQIINSLLESQGVRLTALTVRSFPGAAIIVLHSGIGNRALPYRSNTRAQVASNAFPLISIISSFDVFCNLKIVNTDNRSITKCVDQLNSVFKDLKSAKNGKCFHSRMSSEEETRGFI